MESEINTYGYTSKLSGFHHLSPKERIRELAKLTQSNSNKKKDLTLTAEISNLFIEKM